MERTGDEYDDEICILHDCYHLKERRFFNDALNTFYLWLYSIGHMVKDHGDSEKAKPALHRFLFFISTKGSFVCIIPQTGILTGL